MFDFFYYYGYGYFSYLIFMLPALVISLWAQISVKSTFHKYSGLRTGRGLTGAQAAQEVLRFHNVMGVRCERVAGQLTDHFDPRTNVIRLSDGVYGSDSVSAVGVAAHEAGHAVQYAQEYGPMKLRSVMVPITNIGSRLSWPIIVLGLILGGMMAIDMGGPFNKAAYVFGTAAITAGNYDIMAAVMIGGMTPPCAIALATLLFKNKFTKEERDAGPTNFIMGLAFITEGAIPFAASDPLHVLPSCIIGSALAGALSMAFHCTLMAPHGGIFVFPVVGNAVMYLVALVAGTVVSALLLGVLKKKVTT